MFHNKNIYRSTYFYLVLVSIAFVLIRAIRGEYSRLVFYLIISCSINAQSEAGAIFLLIPPSPTMNGLGEIGVGLPSNDIFAGYFNPANGIIPYQGISITTSKMGTQWLPNLTDNLWLEYTVVGLGLIPQKYPFQIVISQHKTYLDLGVQYRMGETPGEYLGTFHSYMKADALLLGARYAGTIMRLPIHFSIGLSRKTAIQNLVILGPGLEAGNVKSSDKMYDYGLLLSTPFKFRELKPFHDVFDISIVPSLGYSFSNVGDYISFIDPDQADPTPRLLRIGLSLSANISLQSDWNIIEWKGGRSVSDILIDTSDPDDTPYPYQSGLGDIDIVKHIIKSEAESGIEIHRGDEITVFDFYSIRAGRIIYLRGKIDLYTKGYGYRLNGILKFLYYFTGRQNFNRLAQYIDIQYNYSKWTQAPGHPLHNTDFESLVFTFKNLDQFFTFD